MFQWLFDYPRVETVGGGGGRGGERRREKERCKMREDATEEQRVRVE